MYLWMSINGFYIELQVQRQGAAGDRDVRLRREALYAGYWEVGRGGPAGGEGKEVEPLHVRLQQPDQVHRPRRDGGRGSKQRFQRERWRRFARIGGNRRVWKPDREHRVRRDRQRGVQYGVHRGEFQRRRKRVRRKE